MNNNLLADYVALSQFNYIYPFGSLPSNFFFRKVKPNPYWLATELRNTKIALSKKPTGYKADTSVEQEGEPTENTIVMENSFKNLIGPYIDTCKGEKAMQYNYEIQSTVVVEDDLKIDGHVEVSFNLLNTPLPAAFTHNHVKYIKIGSVETTICPSCDGDWKPAIEGVIVLSGKDAGDVEKSTEYNLADATKCDPMAPVSYKIEGNKLIFKLKKEHRVHTANSEFVISIVESKNKNILSIETTDILV